MLYHLLVPHADASGLFNLFRYITFRTAWAMVTALAICYTIYPWFIQWMRAKRMEQIIRTDGPQEHLESTVPFGAVISPAPPGRGRRPPSPRRWRRARNG